MNRIAALLPDYRAWSLVVGLLWVLVCGCFPGPIPLDADASGGADSDASVACDDDEDCRDDDICNGVEKCSNGHCVAGVAVQCDASGTACVENVCNPLTGLCELQEMATGSCDDGDLCTNGDRCESGACHGTARACADAFDCTVDSCAPATGTCVHDASSCECDADEDCRNADRCDGDETCAGYACIEGVAVECGPSGDPCVENVCEPSSGTCGPVPLSVGSCDDGRWCTEGDHCSNGECVGTDRDCDDQIACSLDSCSDDAEECIADRTTCDCDNSADCSDQDVCTGVETCVDHVCVPGVPVTCPTESFKCRSYACDTVTGACELQDDPASNRCDDGDDCTIDDHCGSGADSGRCVGGGRLDCPGDECSMPGICIGTTGECYNNATNHNGVCTSAPTLPARCLSGECVRQPSIDASAGATCAINRDNELKCWGRDVFGFPGADWCAFVPGTACDTPDDVPPLLSDVRRVSVGDGRFCAEKYDGALVCWGIRGALGYGTNDILGVTYETRPETLPAIDVGSDVVDFQNGSQVTCVLTGDAQVRCFGSSPTGVLGLPGVKVVGSSVDPSTPALAGDVDLGFAAVKAIAVGDWHACAMSVEGDVRCWGEAGPALGTDRHTNLGDDETPASAPIVNVGWKASRIFAGPVSSCAITDTGALRCWGANGNGQLGYGDSTTRWTPGPEVELGGQIATIAIGFDHMCLLYADNQVVCLGFGARGALMSHSEDPRIMTPAEVRALPDGGATTADAIAAGQDHTCAVSAQGVIQCWGANTYGQLGSGGEASDDIGDEVGELPIDVVF